MSVAARGYSVPFTALSGSLQDAGTAVKSLSFFNLFISRKILMQLPAIAGLGGFVPVVSILWLLRDILSYTFRTLHDFSFNRIHIYYFIK